MERKDYIKEQLEKHGIRSVEELKNAKMKPLNISLMVSAPVNVGTLKKGAAV